MLLTKPNFTKIFLVAFSALLISANAFASIPQKLKVSENDSTAGYLNGKLVAGTGITLTEGSDGANETLTITNGLGTANGAAEFLYIEGSSADNFEQIIGSVNPTADRNFYFPDAELAAGDVVVGISSQTASYVNLATTQILIGDGSGVPTAAALSGDVTMTNAGVVSIASNAVALGTDTTGNYAATVADAGNSTVTISGSGSESAAITIDVIDVNCNNCIDGTDIALGSDAAGDIMYYNGTDWTRLAKGSAGQYLQTGTTPSWQTPAGAGDMLQATYDTNANNVVDTATALAANGANCSAGSYPLGVDASGAVEGCTSAGSGDITAVGPGFASGDAFTDGVVSTGTTMLVWEGTTDNANELSIISPTADPAGDINITLPSATGTLATIAGTETLTNKTLTAPIISTISNTGTITLPTSTDTLVGKATTDTLTNKTLTSPTINTPAVDSQTTTTFLKIPTGASPTVDAAGKIAEDTTASQLVYGATPNVLDPVRTACARIANVTSTDDNFTIWTANKAVTVTSVGCYCDGTCTTKPTFTLEDNSGNAMTITGTNPTCAATTGSATYAAVTANNGLTAGESMRFDVTNTPSPATDSDLICWTYTVDRQ